MAFNQSYNSINVGHNPPSTVQHAVVNIVHRPGGVTALGTQKQAHVSGGTANGTVQNVASK